VITDPEEWSGAVERVAQSALEQGAQVAGLRVSPLRGADGNVEFLLHLRRGSGAEVTGLAATPTQDMAELVHDALARAGIAVLAPDDEVAAG
jgi:hypothetical protein